MADDPRAEQFEETARSPRDDADRLPTAEAADAPVPSYAPGEQADLDMGGGGPTGADGPGATHRSNLDTGAGASLSGALDDLPDMTGADAADVDLAPTPSGDGSDASGEPADNANMGRGSDRFDPARAYTGDDGDGSA